MVLDAGTGAWQSVPAWNNEQSVLGGCRYVTQVVSTTGPHTHERLTWASQRQAHKQQQFCVWNQTTTMRWMEGERGKAESALKGRTSTMHCNHYATTESTVFTENMTATLDTDKRRGRTEMAGYSPTNLQPCSAHSSTFRLQLLCVCTSNRVW